MLDEFIFHDTAIKLKHLYSRLEQLKTQLPQPSTDGTLYHPQPSSRAPINTHWQSIEDCLVAERKDDSIPGGLRTMILDASRFIGTSPLHTPGCYPTPADMCQWAAFNAQPIVEKFPAATELHDLMITQVDYLDDRVGESAHAERRQTAFSICARLGKMGYNMNAATLRVLAQRGHITTAKRHDGRNMYLFTEVMKYLTTR